jgi:hypothetical protein
MKMSTFSDTVVDALRAEIPSMLASLDPEDERIFLESVGLLSNLSLALASANTDAQKAKIQRNILHVKSTIDSIEGIAKVKAYRAIMRVVTRVLTSLLEAALVSAIA